MAHIKIETVGEGTRVEIHGKTKDLTAILADAIVNDPHFGILIMTAIAAIVTSEEDKFSKINLN